MKKLDKLLEAFNPDDHIRSLYINRAMMKYLKREGDYYKIHESKMVEMVMRINEAITTINWKKHKFPSKKG